MFLLYFKYIINIKNVNKSTNVIVFVPLCSVVTAIIVTYRISTSSASGSSADDAGSCDDRDPNGLDFPVSGFVSHLRPSPVATTCAVSSSLPSPSFAFRCISSGDSVESLPVSECSAAAPVHDDAESVAELSSSGACKRSSSLL